MVSGLISILFLLFYDNRTSLFKNDFLFFTCICFTLGSFLNIYFNAFFYSYDNYKTPNLISGIINLFLLICIPWTPDWLGFINTKIFIELFFGGTLIQGILI